MHWNKWNIELRLESHFSKAKTTSLNHKLITAKECRLQNDISNYWCLFMCNISVI